MARPDDDPAPTRNPAVELLRYVGAVGIVWFHLGGPMAWLGYTALGVFIMLSVVFALQSGTPWARHRVLKIWLFWSAVYAALKVMQALVYDTRIVDEFDWWMLCTGPTIQLWFLPFIYVANGLAHEYVQRVHLPEWVEGPLLSGLAVGGAHIAALLPIPLAQWSIGFSAVFMAILIFRVLKGNWVPLALGMLPVIVMQQELLIAAVPITTAALFSWYMTEARWPYQLGRISLAVYILHGGVATVFGWHTTVWDIALTVVFSTLLGLILSRLPVVRAYL